jgi:hypothetical protein
MITYILQVYRNMQKYKEYNIERKVSKRKRGHAWRRIEHSLESEDGEEDELGHAYLGGATRGASMTHTGRE